MPEKSPTLIEQYGQHIALWFSILLGLGIVVGLGFVAPVLPFVAGLALPLLSTSAIGVGLVTAASLFLYSWLSLEITPERRGKQPRWWSILRAGRLGVALVPVAWLILVATMPGWAAPALLGVACLAPLALVILQGTLGQFFLNAFFQRSIKGYPADHDDLGLIEKAFLWLGANINMALPHAAYRGDRAVDYLLANGADIQGCVRTNPESYWPQRTPLMCVIEAREHEINTYKLKESRPEATDEAIALQRQSVLQAMERAAIRLLDRGADAKGTVFFDHYHNYELLGWSMQVERYDLMLKLIEKGADLDHQFVDKNAGLILAAANNDAGQVATFMNEHRADVNADWRSWGPIQPPRAEYKKAMRAAAANGHVEMIRALHDVYGADLDLAANQGELGDDLNAIELAARAGHVNVVEALLLLNLQQQPPQQNFTLALKLAVQGNHCAVIQVFNDQMVVYNKQSLLLDACWSGKAEVVTFLSQLDGVDVNAPDGSGCTPIMHAAQYKHPDVVMELFRLGANHSVQGPNDWSLRDFVNWRAGDYPADQVFKTFQIVNGMMAGAHVFYQTRFFDGSGRAPCLRYAGAGNVVRYPGAIDAQVRQMYFTVLCCGYRIRSQSSTNAKRNWLWSGRKPSSLPDMPNEMWLRVLSLCLLHLYVVGQGRARQADRPVRSEWKPVEEAKIPTALGWVNSPTAN